MADTEAEWTTREKLAIASYVLRSGEQHWSGVGRLLRPVGEPGRPTDWFRPKHCAQQYSLLMNAADAPKRKRSSDRTDANDQAQASASAEEMMVSRLTKERIEELKKLIRCERAKYRKLQQEMSLVQAGSLDDKLDDILMRIESERNRASKASATVASGTKTVNREQQQDMTAPNIQELAQTTANEMKEEIERLSKSFAGEIADSNLKTTSDTGQAFSHSTEGDGSAKMMAENIIQPPTSVLLSTSTNTRVATSQHEDTVAVSGEGRPETNVQSPRSTSEEHEISSTAEQSPVVKTEEASLREKQSTTAGNLDVTVDEPKDSVTDEVKVIGMDTKGTEESIEIAERKPTQQHDVPETKPYAESEKVGTNGATQWNYVSEEMQEYQKSLSLPGTPVPPGSHILDSCPSSPALSHSSDLDPDAAATWKAWRKSIMILWKQVASHRYASLFLQPVTDEIAPNYSTTVYRSVDLSTMKKNIESGQIRTTAEFRRDLMLMFQNAIMYNYREHDVYKMTMEMQSDVMDQVAQYLATQIMVETTQPPSSKSLRRSTIRRAAFGEKSADTRLKGPTEVEPRRSRVLK